MRALLLALTSCLAVALPACDSDDDCAPPGHTGPASCPSGGDTCSGGENMTDPRAADPLDAQAAEPVLRITWEVGTGPGASLPPAYFDAVSVAAFETDDEVEGLIQEASRPGDREIAITFSSLQDHFATSDTMSLTRSSPTARSSSTARTPA